MARQFGPVISERAQHEAAALIRQATVKPQEQDTRVQHSESNDQLAEILVIGDQNSAPRVRLPKHLAIWNTGRQLSDVNDIVTRGAKIRHERSSEVLVTDEIHAATG